jgi:arabinogalactan endo-1,4-beta-galactosidase
MSNEHLALVVFCAVSGWLVAIIAVVARYQHEKMSPDEFRNLLRDHGIDWLRLRMLLDPPKLPQGGGARDPHELPPRELPPADPRYR